jgi:hypothetical protein
LSFDGDGIAVPRPLMLRWQEIMPRTQETPDAAFD